MNDNIYYVYLHVDPITDEVVYAGHGYKDRAWIVGSTTRSPEHQFWYMSLIDAGYLPTDIVEVIQKGLTKKQACVIEQSYIRQVRPYFNKPQGRSLLKLNEEALHQARALRTEGMFYKDIAEILNVSTMTIYRALNGQTKNLA